MNRDFSRKGGTFYETWRTRITWRKRCGNVDNVRERLKGAENDVEIKRRIIAYVRDCKRGVPPVKKICAKFNLTIKRFYAVFPGKTPELCRLAGKPLPVERMKRTEKAIKSKTAKEQIRREDKGSNLVQLSEEQSKRLLGISHLEKGKNPSLILDELLDWDSKLRKRYKLSLPKTKRVSDFLDLAVERGWSTNHNPNIVSFITDLWNAGFKNMSSQQVKTLVWFMENMQNRKWKIEQIPEFLTKLYNAGVYNTPPETVKKLVRLVEQLLSRKWTPSEFVDYVTDHHSHLQLQERWRSGDISSDELKRRLRELNVN